VQNVRRDEQEGIVWPQAYDEAGHELYSFKLLTSGGTRQFPTDTIINRYETRIAMTALADFLLLGNDASSSGSYALATSKSSMFQSALETWLNTIEDVINDRAVPLLFRQNGINSGPYPKFRHDIVQKPTLTDLATLISAMAGAGAQLFPDADLENHLRGFAELPIREPNDKDQATEEEIISQQLDTLLASSEAEEALADRSAKDANAEGVVPMAQGSVVARMDPVTLSPPAGGATGAAGDAAQPTAPQSAGTGGKKKNSKPGAPTKSTGPVKSKLPPQNRRATISTRAGQGAPAKTTGGLKTRSVAKGKNSDSARGRVMRQMANDFPKGSMEWMHEVPWKGPVEVPIGSLNFRDEREWAANHDPGAVDRYEQDIANGIHKPIVAVKYPGNDTYDIVDGHHHAMAYRRAGVTPLAYVAKVPGEKGPWNEMHSFQRTGGVKKYKLRLKKSKKVSKESVHYRPGNSLKHCGDCAMFRMNPPDFDSETGACTLVQGLISEKDVCDKWEPDKVKKSTDVVMRSFSGKKCDYCQRPATKAFEQQSDGGVLARSCQVHIPQARAEVRWSQNNQVSPNNPMPYDPFPRVLTQ
jgi:hypothetical protein